jgi:TolB-like protein
MTISLAARIETLRPRSRAVFQVLYQRLGEIVDKRDLINEVWGDTPVIDDNVVQCISEVRRLIKEDSTLALKTYPRRGYMLGLSGETPQIIDSESGLPRIAIAQFDNYAQSEDSAFAKALRDDIITEMTRSTEFIVVADTNHDTHYILEGGVRNEVGVIRTNFRLLQMQTNEYIWAERYDIPADQCIQAQRRIAGLVANKLSNGDGIIVSNERKQLDKGRSIDPQAYEYFLLGSNVHDYLTSEGSLISLGHLRNAVEKDPGFSRAWSRLAITYLLRLAYTHTEEPEQTAEDFVTASLNAVKTDPGDPVAQAIAGAAYFSIGETKRGKSAFERAVDTGSDNGDALSIVAYTRPTKLPTADEDFDNIRHALSLFPYHPEWYSLAFGYSAFYSGHYLEAVDELESVSNSVIDKHLYLALCYAELDLPEKSAHHRNKVQGMEPEFTISQLIAGDSIVEPTAARQLQTIAVKAGFSM